MQELGTLDAAGAPVIPPQEVTVADAVVPPHLLRILRVLHADEAQLLCVLRGRGRVCLSGVCVCARWAQRPPDWENYWGPAAGAVAAPRPPSQ